MSGVYSEIKCLHIPCDGHKKTGIHTFKMMSAQNFIAGSQEELQDTLSDFLLFSTSCLCTLYQQ
jgi:hypothetical protein